MKSRPIALGLSAVLLLCVPSGCKAAEIAEAAGTQTLVDAANEATPRTPATIDLTNAVAVTLSGATAESDGSGVSITDGEITIESAGTYVFSGSLTDGRIIVNAKDEDVILVLNDAEITCSDGSPIYIYKSNLTTLHLMEGTKNTLTDGSSYSFSDAYSSAEEDEPNACLYSKSDLVLQGAGSLTVNANYNNGITGKDTLEIYDLSLTVHAANHGINGKDSNLIDSASITVDCGGDAIRSTNDTDETLGWVSVSNSTLNLTSGEDGIQAETTATLSKGSYTITSGGGNTVSPSDDTSAKGIKAGSDLALISGVYVMDCSDDAFHSNGNVTVSNGIYTISTGDDAFHADETLTVTNGSINVLTSYEGLEGSTVDISGGEIYLTSSDDGVNAAGGADGSGFGGFGGLRDFGNGMDNAGNPPDDIGTPPSGTEEGPNDAGTPPDAAGERPDDTGNLPDDTSSRPADSFSGDSSSYMINITGGYLYITAGGDGLDSNGNITMSDGTVIVSSTGRADGALDYEGSFTLSGGTLLAADTGGMSETISEASQYTIFTRFDETLSAGTYVALTSDDQSFVFQLPINAATLTFSSPELKENASYTISYGGVYSGETVDGICTGGTYSGGTELTTLTLSDYITKYGNSGMFGGMGGGRGGMDSGRGGFDGGPDGKGIGGNDTGNPPNGTRAEHPDGTQKDLPGDNMQ